MELDPKSKLVRFAYFLRTKEGQPIYDQEGWIADMNYTNVPRTTTLCAFFWRTFVFMPLFWLVSVVGGGGLLSVFIYNIVKDPGAFFVAAGIILAILIIVACVMSLPAIFKALKTAATDTTVTPVKVAVEGIKTFKSKFCPIITFTSQKPV